MLIFLVIMVALFILVVLLPSLLELRKPKDAGPRKITRLVSASKMELAPSEGLEPSTYELTARCSTELSYDGSINNLRGVAILKNLWRYLSLIDQNRSQQQFNAC